ncbi:MAG: pectinesterase family protein [Haliscomenobacter sp.]
MIRFFLFLLPWLIASAATAQPATLPFRDFTVAADGSGDFRTISEAIHALPMYTYERVVIFIKKGIYHEKIRLEQDHITLLGEDRDSTVIAYSQLREDWEANKDAIGPAVINIAGDDIILDNLTVWNTQPKEGPHAFTLYGTGTRTILQRCRLLSKGADTVSLWNYKQGMYYHSDCEFEGGVDFVCPRGWCYITNSRFFETQTTAAIWHAGGFEQGQKMVIRSSYFNGVPGFHLGRHHYEAQFFLLDCRFSENMADKPIYRVSYPDQPARNRPYFWGDRRYFYNAHKEGTPFSWLENNLDTSGLSPETITAAWTFDGQWDPESRTPPQLLSWQLHEQDIILHFSEPLSIRGIPVLTTPDGLALRFAEGNGRDTLRFHSSQPLHRTHFTAKQLTLTEGQIIASKASVQEKPLPSHLKLN